MRASKESRAHRRWREQVARLIAEACPPNIESPAEGRWTAKWGDSWLCSGGCSEDIEREARRMVIDRVLEDAPFNVHLARSYAESLIAEGERLELERVTFMDWTRTQPGPVPEGLSMSQGMGPENRERGAFVRVDIDADWTIDDNGDHHALPKRGGWPGPLAREWGTVRCEACARGCANCGSPARGEVIAGDDGEWFCSTACHDDHDENSCPLERGFGEVQRRRRRLHGDHCGSCKGRGYVKHPKREAAAANGGAWMIRAARRLLDTIDGRCPWAPSAAAQPSECQRCNGEGVLYRGSAVVGWCTACGPGHGRGTGHNLSGTLPPVEVSPHRRCRARDAVTSGGGRGAARHPLHEHTVVAYEAGRESGWTLRTELDAIDDPGRPLARLAFAERRVARGKPLGGVVPVQRTSTRVEPRREHRTARMSEPDQERGASTVRHLWARAWGGYASHVMAWQFMRTVPRWRRGELRHSEQRRDRERRRTGTAADERRGLDYSDLRELVEMARPVGTVREVRADGSAVVDLDL